MQRRMSSARQAVTRSDNFTGSGKVRACTRRHGVDLEMGTRDSIRAWRRKPVSGSAMPGAVAGVDAAPAAGIELRGMIGP